MEARFDLIVVYFSLLIFFLFTVLVIPEAFKKIPCRKREYGVPLWIGHSNRLERYLILKQVYATVTRMKTSYSREACYRIIRGIRVEVRDGEIMPCFHPSVFYSDKIASIGRGEDGIVYIVVSRDAGTHVPIIALSIAAVIIVNDNNGDIGNYEDDQINEIRKIIGI